MKARLIVPLAAHACAAAMAAGSEGTGTVAPNAGAGSESPCLQVLNSTSIFEKSRLALSSGKMLPSDAGKYGMCMEVPGARYFLVSMTAHMPSAPSTPVPMQLGLCLPSPCGNGDVIELVKGRDGPVIPPALRWVQLSNITSKSPQLDVQDKGYGTDTAAAFFGVLALLVACATCLARSGARTIPAELPAPSGRAGAQLLLEPDEEPARSRFASMTLVKAFSLIGESGTLTKLLESPAYKPTDCLNGLRVLSMVWIILGHTFLMPEGISGYSNPDDIQMSPLNQNAAERSPLVMIILSSQASVDTFFFLSAFLLSFLTLKEFRGRAQRATMGSSSRFVLSAAVMRYLRLTPSLAAVMVVYYKILAFMGSGPFSPKLQDSILSKCDDSWWSELTYTMNFIPFDSDRVCMGWTWYLGDDIIFFIVGIVILPLYNWQKWIGWLSVGTVAGVSCAVGTWLIVKHNLGCYVFDDHYAKLSYWEYSKPYTRFPAYGVGLVTAWLLDELEQRGITRTTAANARMCTRLAAKALAACAFGMLVFIVFIPHTDFAFNKNSWDDSRGNFKNVLNLVVARILWAACWGIITILCYYGFLPLTDGFLSHRVWTPFARLTYGAYLIHPLAIKLAAGRSTQFYTFGGFDIFYRFVGNCSIAFSGSVVLWALVERPMLTLTSAARKKSGREVPVGPSASPVTRASCPSP